VFALEKREREADGMTWTARDVDVVQRGWVEEMGKVSVTDFATAWGEFGIFWSPEVAYRRIDGKRCFLEIRRMRPGKGHQPSPSYSFVTHIGTSWSSGGWKWSIYIDQ